MLQVNFIMIIHKILVLLKINRILKLFLRSIIDFMMKSSRHEEEKRYKRKHN